jgi:hypothetical protein
MQLLQATPTWLSGSLSGLTSFSVFWDQTPQNSLLLAVPALCLMHSKFSALAVGQGVRLNSVCGFTIASVAPGDSAQDQPLRRALHWCGATC